MTERYRYRPEFCEVEATGEPHPDGGFTWAVKDRIVGELQVLTEGQFRERFEPVPEAPVLTSGFRLLASGLQPHERLCVTCRHHETGGAHRDDVLCASPKVAISLASGRALQNRRSDDARAVDGLCGPCGVHWEPVDQKPEVGNQKSEGAGDGF
ncbi:MAG: hypothetical protein AAFX92_03860 [Pseudomonadota bacterium]